MDEKEWLTTDDIARMLQWVTRGRGEYTSGKDISNRKLRLWAVAMYMAASPPWKGRFPKPWLDGEPTGENDNPIEEALLWCDATKDLEGDPPMVTRAALLRDIVGNPWRPVKLPFTSYWSVVTWAGSSIGCPWLTPQVLALAERAYEDRPGRECEGCEGKGFCDWGTPAKPQCMTCKGTGRIADGTLDALTLAALADALEEAGCPAGICQYCSGKGCHYGEERRHILHPANGDAWNGCTYGYLPDSAIIAHLRNPGLHVRGCWVIDLLLDKE